MPVDAAQPYDDSNIFARILRGEIAAPRVYEDAWAIAIRDINPAAPTHLLVLPKGAYVSWDDFSASASDAEIAGFIRAVGTVARQAGLVASGYRILANTGRHAHQTIGHLHVHLFAGRPLGPLLMDRAEVDKLIAGGATIG